MTNKNIDRVRAEQAIAEFLECMGCDLTDPNLEHTPHRFVKMYCDEILSGSLDNVNLRTFPTAGVGDQMVTVTRIPVHSMCAHHLMPIRGFATVGAFYIADEDGVVNLPGLSKYARVVEAFSHQLQLQERLTAQVAKEIMDSFKPDWVHVFVSAEHFCMAHRGVRLHDAETSTFSTLTSNKFNTKNYSHAEMMEQFKLAVK